MDRARYSALAHASCPFAAPVHPDAFARLVERLALREGARVLDLGCGKAELGARIAARWGAHCVGIDRSPYALEIARRRAAGLTRGSLRVLDADLSGPLPEGPWDLVLNIGAMPPGSQASAMLGWRSSLAAGGRLLIGDGYWKRAPEEGYLAALGGTSGELRDLVGTRAYAGELGMETLAVELSADADFEAYETSYRDNIERWVAANPSDPDAPEMAARARSWWGVYDRWGRDTLGFVVLLLG
ncbi:MAG: methyltransferase domain-containing protein [Pseudomonadota bacterium]|nr:methyltransferase domain-containing protein [Pseudomonadota bacterium]